MKLCNIVRISEQFSLNVLDSSSEESKLYEVELWGQKRTLVKGEIPPPEPLLCPSAGLAGIPGRCSLDNEEFIRDPFFQRELYESVVEIFAQLRQDRNNSLANLHQGGGTPPPRATRFTTLVSPVSAKKMKTSSCNDDGHKGEVIRFSNFFDYYRFVYVAQLVLGFDRLVLSPHCGYPPYDPRNNALVLSPLPVFMWRWWHMLEKECLYYCESGDLLKAVEKTGARGLRRGHLCLLDDMVFFFHCVSDEHRPLAHSMLRLHEIEKVVYTEQESTLHCIAITSKNSSGETKDLVFMPQPQIIGRSPQHRFPETVTMATPTSFPSPDSSSPRGDTASTTPTVSASTDRALCALEVKRIVHVLRHLSLGSIQARRVIEFSEIKASSPLQFFTAITSTIGRRLNVICLDSPLRPNSYRSLKKVWEDYRLRARRLISQQREQLRLAMQHVALEDLRGEHAHSVQGYPIYPDAIGDLTGLAVQDIRWIYEVVARESQQRGVEWVTAFQLREDDSERQYPYRRPEDRVRLCNSTEFDSGDDGEEDDDEACYTHATYLCGSPLDGGGESAELDDSQINSTGGSLVYMLPTSSPLFIETSPRFSSLRLSNSVPVGRRRDKGASSFRADSEEMINSAPASMMFAERSGNPLDTAHSASFRG